MQGSCGNTLAPVEETSVDGLGSGSCEYSYSTESCILVLSRLAGQPYIFFQGVTVNQVEKENFQCHKDVGMGE